MSSSGHLISTGSVGTSATASLPCDLANPINEIHKREIVLKGPSQPRNCHSNGNLSFNPAWYDIKEAKGWLEYSPSADRMYCFACRLFESELREKNEPNWIRIGVCNWEESSGKDQKPLQEYSAQRS